ncbi:carboxylesterase/lipase family protein [Amycolatopsis sp. NPDC059027]|uniref:carboxylesterase/lipase family protein n=1 Tax=unclassified Amycolatopsis TaxID=2618356 RepID=UPI00366C1C83
MAEQDENPVVTIETGAVRGCRDGRVAAFLGIPYAAAPLGALRFAAPERPASWEGVRPADRPGPAPIQSLAGVPGGAVPAALPGTSEDCLTVNVWTPAAERGDRLPVLVWLHGGGFATGAGSAACYSGRELAHRGDVVVVTVNYRLGALGYLSLPGQRPGANFGLLDQVAALEWVRDNVAAFGGDPARVTVAGQSAGACSILALATMPHARSLFGRAVLQSAPFTMDGHDLARAEEATKIFCSCAGVGEDIEALRSLSAEQVLAAQLETARRWDAPSYEDRAFVPVVDGTVLTTAPGRAALAGSFDGIDLMIGCTADEGLFFPEAQSLWATGEPPRLTGDLAEEYARLAAARPADPPARVLGQVITDRFVAGSFDLAEHRARTGAPAHVYWWRRPGDDADGRLGAAHCAELPFLFGTFDAWQGSPLIGGTAEEHRYLVERTQTAWLSFVATGNPDPDGVLGWRPYTTGDRLALAFDVPVETMSDVDGRG